MADEYTYKDVIIDPEDPRVEIGKEYYGNSSPFEVLREANGSKDVAELEEVFNDRRGIFKTNYGYYPCIIRKKEPEKKYVPFDLSNEIDRRFLSCRWIRRRNDKGTHIYMITGFHCVPGSNLIAAGNISVNPKDLLEKYEFSDGTPCGKLVEE